MNPVDRHNKLAFIDRLVPIDELDGLHYTLKFKKIEGRDSFPNLGQEVYHCNFFLFKVAVNRMMRCKIKWNIQKRFDPGPLSSLGINKTHKFCPRLLHFLPLILRPPPGRRLLLKNASIDIMPLGKRQLNPARTHAHVQALQDLP